MVLESKSDPSEEQVRVAESSPIIEEAIEKTNHVTEEREKEPLSSGTRDLPKFFYTAMEQVAKKEGFHDGQYAVEVEDGSSKGDGFVGELFRAFLTEGDRREVYLCKIPPLNEARREQFGTMQIFEREALVYNKLLPLMFAYQEEKGVAREDGFFNVPKCYYAHYDGQTEEAIIVMEDLRVKEYNMFNKEKPVDYEHARLTMELLGRYNAVSLALKHDRPKEFEQFKIHDPMKEMMGPGNPFVMMLQKTAMDAIETLEPHETKERTKMQKLLDTIVADIERYDNYELAEPYAVLGHGDCWINNMMYRYRKGAPEQVILLDWQSARYSSPILDLAYFILCCTDEEFRRRHYDEMMTIYYNSLATLLEKLGHSPQQIFPRTAFLRQLRQYGRFGLMLAAFVVPMLCTRNEDLLDMDATAEMFRETQSVDIAIYTKNTNQSAYRKRMSAVIRDTPVTSLHLPVG
uniref:CHK kinase-like domain-containing protein n=1 Tax=Anopheles culicifacies TaxID=139723 RepID=A0A182MI41_9DIPT